jgi:hypothetical protein
MPNQTTQQTNKRIEERIEFDPDDFEIMDLALDHIPELRLCAGIVKTARRAQLQYPVKSSKALQALLPKKSMFVEGHHLHAALIERYMPTAYFPITNERELIARCYIALMRCREDISWAARAPSYASSLLKQYSSAAKQKGGR